MRQQHLKTQFFFFNDTATTEIYTLSLHDALPISRDVEGFLDELQTFHDHFRSCFSRSEPRGHFFNYMVGQFSRSEEHTSELQSQSNLVCRLLLEKKKTGHRMSWRTAILDRSISPI